MVVDMVGKKGYLMATSLFWVGFPYLLMGFSHGYLMLLSCVALVGFGVVAAVLPLIVGFLAIWVTLAVVVGLISSKFFQCLHRPTRILLLYKNMIMIKTSDHIATDLFIG